MIICKNKLAICILTYNRINLLKKTVGSVLNSYSKDYEVFVFNDNSTDGTNDYLQSLQDLGLIQEIRHKKGLGQFGNANFVLQNINAKYCIILHDDDTVEPEHIGDAIQLAERDSNIAVVGTFYRMIDIKDKVIKSVTYSGFKDPVILNDKDFFYHQVQGLNFTWSGSLIRMDKVKDFKFLTNSYFADAIFLANIIVGNKVGIIPEITVNYRIPFDRASETEKMNFDEYLNEWFFIFDIYRDLIVRNDYGKELAKMHKRACTKTLFGLLVRCPSFKSYFKILNSEFFIFTSLSFKNWLQIAYKFMKMCIGK